MIRISTLADYAVLLLAHMVDDTGAERPWSASALAAATGLPLPTVAKLMKMLSKGGFVQAQRGADGGYHLVRDPRALSVAEVIEAVDGRISLTRCVQGVRPCAARRECSTHDGWGRLNAAVRTAFSSVTLAEMAPPLCVKSGQGRLEGQKMD